jgi:hypothetical protein
MKIIVAPGQIGAVIFAVGAFCVLMLGGLASTNSGSSTSTTKPVQTAFEYSVEPPQDWLEGCIDWAHLVNQKYAKYSHLQGAYQPPEPSCRETWKNPAGQRHWHGLSPGQRRKSIWLNPAARQESVRNMPELN